MSYIISYITDFSTNTSFLNIEKQVYVLDPNFATEFKTKKAAKVWIEDNMVNEKFYKVDRKDFHVTNFEAHLQLGIPAGCFEVCSKELSRPYDPETDTPLDVLKWWYMINSDGNDRLIKQEHYDTWPDVRSLYKNIWDSKGYHSSDYKETFTTFELFFPKDSEFEEFKRQMDTILDNFEITFRDDNGWLMFTVFDHFLCEGGDQVFLHKHPTEDKWKIRSRYMDNKAEAMSLRDCFDYFLKHRYYD